MTVRRLVSVLSVCLVASATVVVAQPKKNAKKGPVAPAKEKAPTPAPTPTPTPAGSGAGSAAPAAGSNAGSAVQMAEDPPPSDMEGTNENPDAPKGTGDAPKVVVVATVKKKSGYPIEESQRPITLPQNMSEISLGPHARVSPYAGADALRARYGITRQVQLGLTYVLAGIYDDPKTVASKVGFHPGKAVGLDVTVLLQDWLAVRVGVPIYISPVAVGLQLGAPLKFILTDKFAIGGLDDLLSIRISKFAPTFYQEQENAVNANLYKTNSITSKGSIRASAFAEYQYQPKLVIIGRFGLTQPFDSGASAVSFIRAGFNYSPRRYVDLGLSLGWDDLSKLGGFSPAGLFAIRI